MTDTAGQYAVICLDEDEEETIVSIHSTNEAASEKYEALSNKYPNGAFDVWPQSDVEGLPLSEYSW